MRIVDEDDGRQLNRDYRQKDYATNVLTFDYAQEPMVLADLGAAPPWWRARRWSKTKPWRSTAPTSWCTAPCTPRGWDHETSAQDAREMEAYETAILAELGFADPYA
ncbi:MAG: rRNA maturation RNAse YbeY [Simplicispira sp.]|nr:rRNA maturation RNAse YbeY [Simplicispira sp.]